MHIDWRWKLAKFACRLYIEMLRPWVDEQIAIDGDNAQVSEIIDEFHSDIRQELVGMI